MTINQAIMQLLEIEENRKQNGLFNINLFLLKLTLKERNILRLFFLF
jgi:hypothetical protein